MTSRRSLLSTDMDQAVQKCPGRHDQRPTPQDATVLGRDADDAAAFDENLTGPLKDPLNVGLLPNCVARPRTSTSACLPALAVTRPPDLDFDSAA